VTHVPLHRATGRRLQTMAKKSKKSKKGKSKKK
jgi:hypothetical protein